MDYRGTLTQGYHVDTGGQNSLRIISRGYYGITESILSDAEIIGIWSFYMLDSAGDTILTQTNDYIDNILQAKHTYVKGVGPRFAWSTLNPSQGVYNWAPLDKIIERASVYNKRVAIKINGGGRSEWIPDWVWARIQYLDIKCVDQKPGCRLPIIWDTEYLSAWNTFISALGARYDSNPNIQRVAMVSGWGGEMYYLRGDMLTDTQITQVVNSGFYDNFVPAWRNIIDNYATSFPTKPVELDLAETVFQIPSMNGQDKEQDIANYAISKFGHRLYIQQDGLHDHIETTGSYISHAIMKNHAANGNIIGFQTIDPGKIGNRKQAFERGLAYPIRYVEVFTQDLQNSGQQYAIKYLYERFFYADSRRVIASHESRIVAEPAGSDDRKITAYYEDRRIKGNA